MQALGYHSCLPSEPKWFRRELDRLRESSENPQLLELVDRLISELERDREESRRRFDRYAENLRSLDRRVFVIENSRVFQALQRTAAVLRAWQRRSTAGFRADSAGDERNYKLWIEQETARMPSRQTTEEAARRFTYRPVVSVLMQVGECSRQTLERAIASVHRQSWPEWELCICDDASAEPWMKDFLDRQAESDARIRYVRSADRMGPASSLNRAGILSSGEYLATLDPHDTLSANALFQAVECLQTQRFDLLYGDEDHLDDSGLRRAPVFKPGWSPELLTSSMYLGRFLVISRTAMECAEWFRSGFDGAHLYDLALRLAEGGASVKHVPRILVHRGPADESTEPRKRVLAQAIERRGWHAGVTEGQQPGAFEVRRRITGAPLVSLVICSKTPRLLEKCLRAIDCRTAYPVREIVVVEHRFAKQETGMDRLLKRSHCVRVPYSGPFDFARMNNLGVEAANGGIIVLMNDDVEPLSAEWLNELIGHVQRPEIAVAGPRLLYPHGAIQHAGIAVGIMDGAGHPNRGGFETSRWPWSGNTRNVSAVTGACMAMRRGVFEELGGFDTAFPVNYNDVDFCLRARRAGYHIIYEPAAVLQHYESGTRRRGTTWQERELFHERWGHMIEQGDPYYNPNLTRTREDCSLPLG